MTLLAELAAIVLGLGLLTWSSDKFVDGAANIARITGISPLIIGIVVIGFGTSAPEMIVSATAALDESPGIALGNAIGSNITNIALILGVTALITSLPVQSTIIKREVPLLLVAGALSYLLLIDGYLSRFDGVWLILFLVISMGFLIYQSQKSKTPDTLAVNTELPDEMPFKAAIYWTLGGIILLVISSKMLVWGAIGIAHKLGVSDLVIGLTIIAIGTSLPELAASISSARKGQADLAVGNIVGSNLFNNLAVIGIAALIHPLGMPSEVLTRDLPIMMALTVAIAIFTLTPPLRNVITRWEAITLLACFIGYQLLLYFQTVGT